MLRQRARGRGVPAFSVLDLATILRAHGADSDTEDELARRLAAQGVVDMPLTAAALAALGSERDWEQGSAHAALARPGWWGAHEDDWGPLWHQVAVAACAHSPAALILITRAAIAGATLHALASRHTQRYQQLAALAVVACHTAGQPVPEGFLAALADGAPARMVPKPEYIRASVADELAGRGVPDPGAVVATLLPATASAQAETGQRS